MTDLGPEMQAGPIPAGLCQCGCGERTTIASSSNAKRGVVKGQPMRFIHGHMGQRRPAPACGYVVEDRDYTTPCWVWKLHLNWAGYPMVTQGDRSVRAHIVMYERHVGPVPDGLCLDHLCRVRACVNPEHLEPVTNRENILRGEGHAAVNARKTHCFRGHEVAGENVYVNPKGWRLCRACRNIREAA